MKYINLEKGDRRNFLIANKVAKENYKTFAALFLCLIEGGD